MIIVGQSRGQSAASGRRNDDLLGKRLSAKVNEPPLRRNVDSRPVDSCVVFDMEAQTCYRRDLKYDYE